MTHTLLGMGVSEVASIAFGFRVDGGTHVGGHVAGTVHKVLYLLRVAEHFGLVSLVRYSLNSMDS